jgi:hypothetical protein
VAANGANIILSVGSLCIQREAAKQERSVAPLQRVIVAYDRADGRGT